MAMVTNGAEGWQASGDQGGQQRRHCACGESWACQILSIRAPNQDLILINFVILPACRIASSAAVPRAA